MPAGRIPAPPVLTGRPFAVGACVFAAPERDPHDNARAALIRENPEDPGILGQEQRAAGQYRDLALG